MAQGRMMVQSTAAAWRGFRVLLGAGMCAAALAAPTYSWAQATRTWVSGVGDDANPCSRTAPCKTFAGAISKTAPGGEIDALDPGGFGALTITKAITIDGGGGQVASVLVSGTNGIVVNAGSSDTVILRNLSLNGLGTGLSGIAFNGGKSLRVQNVRVDRFTGPGLTVAPGAAGSVVEVLDSVFSNNGVGLLVANQSASAPPVMSTVSVERSRFVFNSNTGIWSTGAGSLVRVANSTVFGNGAGLSTAAIPTAAPPSAPYATTAPGQLTSFGNNQVQGNTVDGSFTGTASNN